MFREGEFELQTAESFKSSLPDLIRSMTLDRSVLIQRSNSVMLRQTWSWSFPTNLDFLIHIFATQCRRSLLFQTINSVKPNSLSFKETKVFTIRWQRYMNYESRIWIKFSALKMMLVRLENEVFYYLEDRGRGYV